MPWRGTFTRKRRKDEIGGTPKNEQHRSLRIWKPTFEKDMVWNPSLSCLVKHPWQCDSRAVQTWGEETAETFGLCLCWRYLWLQAQDWCDVVLIRSTNGWGQCSTIVRLTALVPLWVALEVRTLQENKCTELWRETRLLISKPLRCHQTCLSIPPESYDWSVVHHIFGRVMNYPWLCRLLERREPLNMRPRNPFTACLLRHRMAPEGHQFWSFVPSFGSPRSLLWDLRIDGIF